MVRWGCVCRINLDHRHHSPILVLEDVAVVDEPPDDVWIGERYKDLHHSRFPVHRERQVHRVVDSVKRPSNTVDLRHEEFGLMDVEVVHLAGDIHEGPFLDVTQAHARVHAVGIELLAIDEEEVAVGALREGEGAAVRDWVIQDGVDPADRKRQFSRRR